LSEDLIMSRVCNICRRLDRAEIDRLLSSGDVSDHAVARRFKIGRSSITRHRQRHILKPLADQAALLARDAAEKRQRKALAQAVTADQPSTATLIETHLGARATVEKLVDIDKTLVQEIGHHVTTHNGTAVAALSGQRIRGVEVGAKIAGVGGYRPTVMEAGGAAGMNRWSIQIIMPNANRTETINVVGPIAGGDTAGETDSGDVIDGSIED
jgi:hypothetical protein